MRCLPIIALLSTAILAAACDRAPDERSGATPGIDRSDVALNNRGVGLMGRFEYDEARQVFERLAERRPDWTAAHLNLAIATLNRQRDGDQAAALRIVESVLERHPGNPRAHYIAGILAYNAGRTDDADRHFSAVLEADPSDAYGHYFLAQTRVQQDRLESALRHYRAAERADPYLRSAPYGAFAVLRRLGRDEAARKALERYRRLENNPRARLAEIKYTRMGPKAEATAVNAGLPAEPSERPDGPLFERPIQLARLSQPPASVTVADVDGDGNLDLYAASPEGGTTLLNTGEGSFRAAPEHPLSGLPGRAMAWGDYDNDGRTDAYLAGPARGHLWRARPKGWEEQKLNGEALGPEDPRAAMFVDADHDGDLDILTAGRRSELLNNDRDGSFRRLAEDADLAVPARRVHAADLDGDRDLDLLFASREANRVFLNDRLWNWRRDAAFEAFEGNPIRAMVAGDADADGRMEIYVASRDGGLQRWTPQNGAWRATRLAGSETTWDWLALADADGDGSPDLWTASPERGWAVWRLADGALRELHREPSAGGRAWALLPGADNRGPGLVAWREGSLTWWPPGAGRHSFLSVGLSGKQEGKESMRSNASGIGAQVTLRVGTRWTRLAQLPRESGAGQSLVPLQLGLGGAESADFLAVEWPDGVYQTELELRPDGVTRISETQRQLASCPVLFAWDGERFAFVSDVLGVGGLGFAVSKGTYAEPRPWEHFLLPPGLLKARDGLFRLRLTEPMEEIGYLDSVGLVAWDLPPGWHMLLDERMGTGKPAPTGRPLFYRTLREPSRARDAEGTDILPDIAEADGKAADPGPLDARFTGFLADRQVITLEFDASLAPGEALPVLIMDGWVEYGYSQTGFAAWQAGIDYAPPSLEIRRDGQWEMFRPSFGYPAGMPRRAALPLDGLPAGVDALRLTTNMQIYYDRLAVAMAESAPGVRRHEMDLKDAELARPGFPHRVKLAQRRPQFDYHRRRPFWDARYPEGHYTRLGPVRELVAHRDGALAIFGPGEEIRLRFDARLPAPPPGWSRRFVAQFEGWAKDMDLYTREGGTVAPVPGNGRRDEAPRRQALHTRYNTRFLGGK